MAFGTADKRMNPSPRSATDPSVPLSAYPFPNPLTRSFSVQSQSIPVGLLANGKLSDFAL